MKNRLQVPKLLASILLLLSFFLPMSSCSYTVSPRSGVVEERIVFHYPREYVDPGEIGAWLNILAFFWPVPVMLLQRRCSDRKYAVMLTWTGLFLSVLSLAAVYTWADIGTPLTGARVGGGAAGALVLLYGGELVGHFKSKYAGHRTPLD